MLSRASLLSLCQNVCVWRIGKISVKYPAEPTTSTVFLLSSGAAVLGKINLWIFERKMQKIPSRNLWSISYSMLTLDKTLWFTFSILSRLICCEFVQVLFDRKSGEQPSPPFRWNGRWRYRCSGKNFIRELFFFLINHLCHKYIYNTP